MKLKIITILFVLFLAGCALQETTGDDSTLPEDGEINEPETAASCDDGIKNQDETDIDCGGVCDKCSAGKSCESESDCVTGFCRNNVCAVPSCQDDIQNQNETGVDCGGPCESCEGETTESEYELDEEDREALEEKLTIGTKSTFLANAYPSGVDVGESHVFGFGITNTQTSGGNTTFRFHIEFRDARDNRNNPIDAEEDTVLEWFSENEFPEPTLGKYKQKIFPVGVTVGEEMAPGKETEAGSYYFTLITEYKKSYRFETYSEKDFSFKVN